MGGMSSTRWQFTRTKQVVESSLQITAPRTHKRGVQVLASTSGVYRWPEYGRTIPYQVAQLAPDAYAMTLFRSTFAQHITLTPTRANIGEGRRWWFECPDCGRRSLKLYLPPRASHFKCRACHDLSYDSAQGAGSLAYRLFQSNARAMGVSTRTARERIRKQMGGRVVADLVGQAEPAGDAPANSAR